MRRLRSRNHPSDALAAMSLLFLAGPLTARSLGDASTTMPQGRGPIAVELSRRPGSRELAGAMPAPSRRHRALGDDGGANPAGVVGVVDCENAEYSGLIGCVLNSNLLFIIAVCHFTNLSHHTFASPSQIQLVLRRAEELAHIVGAGLAWREFCD